MDEFHAIFAIYRNSVSIWIGIAGMGVRDDHMHQPMRGKRRFP
jgi:hypothetical protein